MTKTQDNKLLATASKIPFEEQQRLRRHAISKLRETMTVAALADTTGFSATCITHSHEAVLLEGVGGRKPPQLPVTRQALLNLCYRNKEDERTHTRNAAIATLLLTRSTAQVATLTGYCKPAIVRFTNKNTLRVAAKEQESA